LRFLDFCEVGFDVRVVDRQQPHPKGAQDIFGFLCTIRADLSSATSLSTAAGSASAEVVVDVGKVNSNLPGR